MPLGAKNICSGNLSSKNKLRQKPPQMQRLILPLKPLAIASVNLIQGRPTLAMAAGDANCTDPFRVYRDNV